MENDVLRILITKEEDMFVAQCLEHDICVQGPNMTTLQCRFEDALVLESAEGDLSALPQAPAVFHERWEAGLALQSTLENAEVRLAA